MCKFNINTTIVVFNTCVEYVLNSRLDSSQTQIVGYFWSKMNARLNTCSRCAKPKLDFVLNTYLNQV